MHPVDAFLEQARHLLGTQAPPSLPHPTYSPPRPISDWTGQAADLASTTNPAEQLAALEHRHAQAATIVETANAIAEHAHSALAAIQTAWEQDKTAVENTDTADAHSALLRAAQHHIDEATHLIEHTAGQYQHCAQQLQALTTQAPPPTP